MKIYINTCVLPRYQLETAKIYRDAFGDKVCVEHSAPKGSRAYEESMYHIMLTKKYAESLRAFKSLLKMSVQM